MGAFEEAKEWMVETFGMWWPDADEGKLREAADAWRTFADAVDDVCHATNRQAGTIIYQNEGEASDAFQVFWGRYHTWGLYNPKGTGWLDDLAESSRDMAKALDEFATEVEGVKNQIDTQLAIQAGVIVAGIGLAVLTAGLASSAAAAAAVTISEFAASMGVALSATAARIAATTMVTAAFGGIESVTVNLAVAQPMRINAGLQDGLNLARAQEAGTYGILFGAGFGSVGSSAKAIKDVGGLRNVLDNINVPSYSLRPVFPGGEIPPGWLTRSGKDDPLKHSPRAWPSNKRKGPTNPKHRADVKGDEGKNGSHALERHVHKTTRDMRARMRSDPKLDADSRFLSEEAAQKFTDKVLLRNQDQISNWLEGNKPRLPPLTEEFGETTGLSLSRKNYLHGYPPEEVNSVTVIIKRDASTDSGFRIVTAYPTSGAP